MPADKFRLFDFSFDSDPPIHILGRIDRRNGAEHGDPWGRSDDGSALSLSPFTTAGRHGPGGQRFCDPRPVRPCFFSSVSAFGCFTGCFLRQTASIRSDEGFTYFIIHYLPTGVLGLVIAAIFSAAMGTLAGSLNSSASTIVNDLYRPFTGQSDERHLMRVGRVMTVVWGGRPDGRGLWCSATCKITS